MLLFFFRILVFPCHLRGLKLVIWNETKSFIDANKITKQKIRVT